MSEEHDNSQGDAEGSHQLLAETNPKTKTPNLYKVVMLNDDFTPRDFVIHVLQKFFAKEEPQATQIMLEIHHKGSGVAGVYSFEIAETKAYQCNEFAKQNSFPLKCMVEKA
jgi:ATP-dependent Clp protease adaptor protein ClpS